MSPTCQVLVVEDDPGTRTLFRAILERHGLSVSSAGDGDEALELLSEARFDAIVLDLMMPGTDGAGVLRQLMVRSPETLHQIVVVTAMGAAQLRRIPELEQVAAVLRKPLDILELSSEVLRCVAATVAERDVQAAAVDHRLAN
jgi:CheY-like chemotaxis protein